MDFFKNNLIAGIGLACAASVLAPIVFPVAARIGRPLAKSLVRGGMIMYEKGREVIAVAGESVEDIMAEIRAERGAPAAAASAAATAADTHPQSPAAAGTSADTSAPPEPSDLARWRTANGPGPGLTVMPLS